MPVHIAIRQAIQAINPSVETHERHRIAIGMRWNIASIDWMVISGRQIRVVGSESAARYTASSLSSALALNIRFSNPLHCACAIMFKGMHIADVYASQMDQLRLGHALWCPDGDDLSIEIQIGDVGHVREGIFMRLYNAKLPADDPSHSEPDLVPPDYKPFVSQLGERPHSSSIAPCLLSTRGIKHKSVMASGGA